MFTRISASVESLQVGLLKLIKKAAAVSEVHMITKTLAWSWSFYSCEQSLNKPHISFSRSNMALAPSSCSQLTWLFWPWASSPRVRVPWSFPLALCAPTDILKHIFSFLFDLVLKWSHDGPSTLSPCKPPFWLQCGVESKSGWSSSPLVFVEARESCDLDRVSPLKIILKWEVKGLSESSVLSWEQFSFAGSFSVSAPSGGSEGGSHSEITIDGIAASGTLMPILVEAPGFSKGRGVDSRCEDRDRNSFGASIWGLELCKGKQSGCSGQLTLRHRFFNTEWHSVYGLV